MANLSENHVNFLKPISSFFFVNRGLSKNTVVKTAHSPSWQAEEVTICVVYCWYTIFTIIPLFSNAKILSLFFIQKNADYLGIFFIFRKDRYPDVGPCPALGPNKFASDSALET